jgi:5-methylcytosine-specific restriction endonuclease McrA
MAPVGDQSLITQIYRRAQQLRRWFNVVVDHRIPLIRGGLHHAGNLQIIYQRENARKADRLDFVPSVIFA